MRLAALVAAGLISASVGVLVGTVTGAGYFVLFDGRVHHGMSPWIFYPSATAATGLTFVALRAAGRWAAKRLTSSPTALSGARIEKRMDTIDEKLDTLIERGERR